MSEKKPLDSWKFLIGKWKGASEGNYAEEERIVSAVEFSEYPSERFIMEKSEATKNGELVNRSIGFIFYDGTEKKFRRKTVFSYGFVNNGVEYETTDNEIRFDVVVEPYHKGFAGLRWRSYIKKISTDKIAMGLENAKEGEDFKSYGETIFERIT